MSYKIAWHGLQAALTAVGGWVGWYLGGLDGFLYALIAFVVIDYVTGVIAAYATGRLSSKRGFIGIARKVMIFALVGAANLLDVYILKQGSTLRTATIFFYLSNEGISLLENATVIGLPVPEPLQNALRIITRGKPNPKPDETGKPVRPAPAQPVESVEPATAEVGSTATHVARHAASGEGNDETS